MLFSPDLFVDNQTGKPYRLTEDENALALDGASRDVPIVDGIPRFVGTDQYAKSFSKQWDRYSQLQIDSLSGSTISTDAFFRRTGWTAADLQGKKVLEVGCGAGRYSEVLLSCGAEVCAFDLSYGVDIALQNNMAHADRFHVAQASIYDIPFHRYSFDYVYCVGVLQYTPWPELAFMNIASYLKPGGRITADCYLKDGKVQPWKAKYLWRWLTTRMDKEFLFKAIEFYVPKWIYVDTAFAYVPWLGRYLSAVVPCYNYATTGRKLSRKEINERSVFDTYNNLSATYDNPVTLQELRRWFDAARLREIEIIDAGGIVVGRGRR